MKKTKRSQVSVEANNVSDISRPVSAIEYYHASVATAKRTLEVPRECVCVITGAGSVDYFAFKKAVYEASTQNPGTRLSWQNCRSHSQWATNGVYPHVRVVNNSAWDANSNIGSEFIYETPLSLTGGPSTEVILHTGQQDCIILRTLHAVMDGFGMLHFLQEIFRSLRGEPLLGSNTLFSDVDLMSQIPSNKRPKIRQQPRYLTGGPQGNRFGDQWERFEIKGTPKDALASAMSTVAQYSAQFSSAPCIIALPINLRRHYPQIITTTNFASMIHLHIEEADSYTEIRRKLREALEANMDAELPKGLDVVKYLPLSWIDKMLSRTPKNYKKRPLFETSVVSKLGYFSSELFKTSGFRPESIFTIPIPGNTRISISALDQCSSIAVGMENIYASEGRFDAFTSLLHRNLSNLLLHERKAA